MTYVDPLQISDHLDRIAKLFYKDGEPFKARAFSKVGATLKTYKGELTFTNGILNQKIPGVGSAINDTICEYMATGTSRKLSKLLEKHPEEEIIRHDVNDCISIVDNVMSDITSKGIDWGYAGSIRRGLPTAKDVDVIVSVESGKEKQEVIDLLLKKMVFNIRNGKSRIASSLAIGDKKFNFDLNFTTPKARGAHYLYFTGSKDFNISQRGRAKAKGFLLSQLGLFKGDDYIAGRTEEDIFEALGEAYKSPKDRII